MYFEEYIKEINEMEIPKIEKEIIKKIQEGNQEVNI